MPTISGVGNRRPRSTTTIRPSYSTTVMFLPISPSPPSGRTRSLPLKRVPRRPGQRRVAHDPDLGLVALDQREAHGRRRRCRAAAGRPWSAPGCWCRTAPRRRPAARRRSPRAGRARPTALHLVADDVGRDADAAGAADVHRVGEDVVVAGEHRQPVDEPHLIVVGLLEPVDAVDLGQLGEQVRPHVRRRPRRDVVDDDRARRRRASATASKCELDPALVGAVVVRRDAQQGVDPDRGRRSVRWSAWRVSLEPTPPTISASSPNCSLISLMTPRCSSSVIVDASPVVPHTTSPSDPLVEQIPGDGDGPVLVDGPIGREGGDHGGEQSLQHAPSFAGRGARPTRRGRPKRP